MERPDKEQLLAFLRAVDRDFPVPLSQKVALEAYAAKLADRATLCASFDGGAVCALVAGYTENLPEDGIAYIALAATKRAFRRQGHARRLVRAFLTLCAGKGIPAVHLYTDRANTAAQKLYLDLGFAPYCPTVETRPADSHWIYCFAEKKGGVQL